jgi:hypothetical protein
MIKTLRNKVFAIIFSFLSMFILSESLSLDISNQNTRMIFDQKFDKGTDRDFQTFFDEDFDELKPHS